MNTASAVADKAARLGIPCGSGLAQMAIPTPCATQRELALKENVEGPVDVIHPEQRRAQAILLPYRE